jgi:hypothetical protein
MGADTAIYSHSGCHTASPHLARQTTNGSLEFDAEHIGLCRYASMLFMGKWIVDHAPLPSNIVFACHRD